MPMPPMQQSGYSQFFQPMQPAYQPQPMHMGQQMGWPGVCFNCGKTGHKRDRCPEPPRENRMPMHQQAMQGQPRVSMQAQTASTCGEHAASGRKRQHAQMSSCTNVETGCGAVDAGCVAIVNLQQTDVYRGFFSFFSQTLPSTSLHFTPSFLTFYLHALALHSVSVYFSVRRPSDQVTKSKHAPPSPLACLALLACSPPLVTLRTHSLTLQTLASPSRIRITHRRRLGVESSYTNSDTNNSLAV